MPFNGKTKWILWLAGILFSVIFTVITALANNVIINDKASRERDTGITSCLHKMQTDIVQRLVRIETKLDE